MVLKYFNWNLMRAFHWHQRHRRRRSKLRNLSILLLCTGGILILHFFSLCSRSLNFSKCYTQQFNTQEWKTCFISYLKKEIENKKHLSLQKSSGESHEKISLHFFHPQTKKFISEIFLSRCGHREAVLAPVFITWTVMFYQTQEIADR